MYERNDNDQWKKGETTVYSHRNIFYLFLPAIPKMQHLANNTSRDHTAHSTTVRDRVNCENGPICIGSVTEDS